MTITADTITTVTESVDDRIIRLGLTDIGESRLESLSLANDKVGDADFSKLSDAIRLARNSETIVLPTQRFEMVAVTSPPGAHK